MARRSLLLSKKRSSKATISKKRKADKELRQTSSTKRVRQSNFEEDEEEIGDFIVVDTGTLYEPQQTERHFTSDEEESHVPTPPISRTPVPSIELIEEVIDEEVVAKLSPEIASPVSDKAPGAIKDLLVLPLSTETSEGSRSREQCPSHSEEYVPSGSKEDPIVLSPLPPADEEGPPTPIGPPLIDKLDELDESISVSLRAVSEHDAQVPQIFEDLEAGHSSISSASVSQDRLTLDDSIVQSCATNTPETTSPSVIQANEQQSIEIPTPRKFGDAPLGVLVTRGDQCPSKFVVSGNTAHSGVDHQVSIQKESQPRSGATWFETVTESIGDTSPQLPSLDSSQSAEPKTDNGSDLTISQQKYQEYLKSLDALASARDEGKSPARANRVDIAGSKERRTSLPQFPPSQDVLQKRTTAKQKPQVTIPDAQIPSRGDSKAKQLPFPVSGPTSSTESVFSSGTNLSDSATERLEYCWSMELSCSDAKMPPGRPLETAAGINPRISLAISKTLPHTLTFTAENRAQSALITADVQQLIQLFVRDSMVILPQQQTPKAYPAGVVIWQSLQRFHKWYIREEKLDSVQTARARSSAITTLRFELLDVHWQPEKIFYLPRQATGFEFRDLKQCIWDLFWVSANMNGDGNTKPFRISITPAPDMMDGAKLGHLIAAYSPTVSKLPPPVFYQQSPPSTFDKMGPNFRALEPSTTHHHHRIPGTRPPALTLESPQITLEVEGAKTPQMLREFLQKGGNTPDNSQPASLQSSPTRPQSHGSSTGQIELLHPPLLRPERNMTAAFQPQRPSTNNTEPRVTLPPLETLRPAQTSSSGSKTQSSSFQNNNTSRATQLPSPRPSPVMTDTYQPESLRGRLSTADNNYAANTARPMFSVPHQKAAAAPPTVQPPSQNIRVTNTAQPSAPNNRVPNTAQPAPNILIAPSPTQTQPKEVQPETTPAISQSSRPPRETKRFRDAAIRMLSNRPTIVLEANETTGGRKRTFPEISGVIVDKNSEMGLVVITERGYTIQQVNTGQDVYFEQYTELTLKEGQACVIHGSSTVLYYKTRSSPLRRNRERRPLPSEAPAPRIGGNGYAEGAVAGPGRSIGGGEERQEGTAAVDIKIRLQKDAAGRFTAPHPFAILQSTDLQDFMEWFAEETGRDDALRPEKLRFILKDAMPVAKTYEVYIGWGLFEEKFEVEWRRVREEIVRECERAKAFLPDLREFGVLVVDPGWIET
ncbi:hypothetical protein N431DRAFT_393530 [Stipitochalara longipes BDJ]|nr:hypothetical protein N431DRAFT_393530 [Stipitochalara longipes BDJ]